MYAVWWKVRVLRLVWIRLLLTGFTYWDDDVQMHNVIRLNGCHRIMFQANITRYKEIGGEGIEKWKENDLCMGTKWCKRLHCPLTWHTFTLKASSIINPLADTVSFRSWLFGKLLWILWRSRRFSNKTVPMTAEEFAVGCAFCPVNGGQGTSVADSWNILWGQSIVTG